MSTEPCPKCGNKPFGGKIKHKKDCKKIGAEELAKEVVAGWVGPDKGYKAAAEVLAEKKDFKVLNRDFEAKFELETINGHICCGEPMRRTDGAPWEVMCQHSRLLTGECAECRKQHGGILTYHCKLCGRNLQDSPQLAQGPEANTAMWTIRR